MMVKMIVLILRFVPKPDSPCIYMEGNTGPDGCAIFYRGKE